MSYHNLEDRRVNCSFSLKNSEGSQQGRGKETQITVPKKLAFRVGGGSRSEIVNSKEGEAGLTGKPDLPHRSSPSRGKNCASPQGREDPRLLPEGGSDDCCVRSVEILLAFKRIAGAEGCGSENICGEKLAHSNKRAL